MSAGGRREAQPCPFAGTAYENSPVGWWTEGGGALDVASGVVHFPPDADPPPCAVPECERCAEKSRAVPPMQRTPRERYLVMEPWILSECDHEWVPWSGKPRCRKCGATQ